MKYFGVQSKDRLGHYLFDETLRNGSLQCDGIVPGGNTIDGGFCPTNTRMAGVAKVTHVDGKTVLAFWDYSCDHRPGSNSNFIEDGTLSFKEMLANAKEKFPSIFERFTFPIVEGIETT